MSHAGVGSITLQRENISDTGTTCWEIYYAVCSGENLPTNIYR